MSAVAAVRVSDPADPRIADYRNIPDPELVARLGTFVAEGRLVVRRLLTGGRLLTRSVLVTEPALRALEDVLAGQEVPVYLVTQPVMDAVAGFNIHRGCLAMGERPPRANWRELVSGARRLVVLERVGNADNIGSIFRNAAAFGADAVLLGPDCVDPLYRKSIRTSMGTSLSVPFADIEPWPHALGELEQSGFATIALSPAPQAGAIRDVASTIGDRPAALVAGHEGTGLTAEAIESCRLLARIPMAGGVDSLNVATAVGIGLYELSRMVDGG
jgi:tRNA G18 (ribose-2'-O)-methylase SpoU